MYIVPVVQVYVAGILEVFFSVGLCWGGVVLVWVHWAFCALANRSCFMHEIF